MRPILILENRREVAEAMEALLSSAHYQAMVRPFIDRFDELAPIPAAIIVRVAFEGVSEPAHAAVERLPANHPPVIAIAREERELCEARRLKCDVVLHAPHDLGRLPDVLTKLVPT